MFKVQIHFISFLLDTFANNLTIFSAMGKIKAILDVGCKKFISKVYCSLLEKVS